MSATRDGKMWRCQFYYKDWKGVSRKKNKRGFKTKAEAEQWERDFLQQQQRNLDINFENFVQIYYEDMQHRLRENTMRTRKFIIDLKIIPYFKKKNMNEIKTSDIRAWQNALMKKGYSQTYLKTVNNQKKYLEGYAKQQGYDNVIHYTDDGYSGGNFNRPAWKRLVADIEAGKVAHVIVKDMSRIGRDYLQTGFYTEIMFREHGVHFVAISNSVDSNDQNSNEFAPFLNIMNEWYLRDLSRKQKTAIRIKGESGKPTTNTAIYGYKKDPADKYHWLIDEEAAAVVRRIFRMNVEGIGPYEIARILYEDKVETPAVHLGKKGIGFWKSKEDFPNPYNWNGYMVGQILSKPEYIGHTVNFRSHKESYKDKSSVPNPQEEWLIFENTHEAIIDKETWELVQKLRKTPRRKDTLGEANPLTGLVFCADCGAKMYNHRFKGDLTRFLFMRRRRLTETGCRRLRFI